MLKCDERGLGQSRMNNSGFILCPHEFNMDRSMNEELWLESLWRSPYRVYLPFDLLWRFLETEIAQRFANCLLKPEWINLNYEKNLQLICFPTPSPSKGNRRSQSNLTPMF